MTQVNALVQRVKVALQKYPTLRFSFTIATLGNSGGNQLGTMGNMVMNAIVSAGLINSVYVNLMVG
jgi:hypothetical protein